MVNVLRGIAVALTQAPLVFFLGARFDLLFGFNRMDAGFGVLLFLFLFVPVLNLGWVVAEVVCAFRRRRHQGKALTFGMPLVAVFFLLESLAIDLYIASHARM